jgi:hypothetical protein
MTVAKTTLVLALGFGLFLATGLLGAETDPAPDVAKTAAPAKKEIAKLAFLDKQAGRKAIIDDKLAPYFNQMQPMEMSAKTGLLITGKTLVEQQAQCRRRYQDTVLEFTDAEKEALSWYVNRLHPLLSKDYSLLAAMPWSFIKVSDVLEGGLPHTRGAHIVFSERWCKRIVRLRQIPIEQPAHMSILVVLVHEQIHVYQRMHPGSFDSLYKKVWGFQKVKAIKGCDWLVEHHLVNPDGVDCTWVMPMKPPREKGKADQAGQVGQVTYLWPLVVLAESVDGAEAADGGQLVKRMPADIRMLGINVTSSKNGFAVELDQAGKPVSRNLKSIAEYRAKFPMSSSLFHPNEIAADMFGYVVLFDYFIPKSEAAKTQRQKVEPHLAKVRKWFRANLGSASSTGKETVDKEPADKVKAKP